MDKNTHTGLRILGAVALAAFMLGCSGTTDPIVSQGLSSGLSLSASSSALSQAGSSGASGSSNSTGISSNVAASAGSSGLAQTSSSNSIPISLGATPVVTVLPWNGAKGAYSLIMDDYGGWGAGGTRSATPLIWAESEAYARQLTMAVAVITTCTHDEWLALKLMIQHGSEAVNHSLTHVASEDPTASTQLMKDSLGVSPTFYGYPYDISTPAIQATLKALGYLGSRSSNVDTSWPFRQFNAPTLTDGFSIVFDGRRPPPPGTYYYSDKMDEYADSAVAKGMWAIRETHGIADGTYGEWSSQAEFSSHLDHLAALRDQGKLWVAPPSRVLRYLNLANKGTWSVARTADAYEVHWSNPADTLARYAVPLRLQVCGSWSASQGGVDLGATTTAGQTFVSVDPSQGNLRLVQTAGSDCTTGTGGSTSSSGTVSSSNSAGNGSPVTITGTKQDLTAGTYAVTTACSTQLQFSPPTGGTDISVTVNGVAHSGQYSLEVPPPGSSFSMVLTGSLGVLCW